MAALTKNRKTAERIPALRQFTAGSLIFAGSLVALNASGKAVPASNTSGLTVIGVAQTQTKEGGMVTVKSGCFRLANSESAAVTLSEVGDDCFVADDQTVAKSGSNSVVAGKVYDLDSKGVWVLIG